MKNVTEKNYVEFKRSLILIIPLVSQEYCFKSINARVTRKFFILSPSYSFSLSLSPCLFLSLSPSHPPPLSLSLSPVSLSHRSMRVCLPSCHSKCHTLISLSFSLSLSLSFFQSIPLNPLPIFLKRINCVILMDKKSSRCRPIAW